VAQFVVSPSSLKGTIRVPPSKSHTLRALLFALMAEGKSIIRNPLFSQDTEAMIRAISSFGAQVACYPDRLEVMGLGGKIGCAEDVIDAGGSGIVLRFIGALAALSPTYTVITGDPAIRNNRVLLPLIEGLQKLGAFATSARLDGHAPLIVRGPILPGKTALSGEDSQPVSALLIALSFLPGRSEITVANPGEKPWVEMTLQWLKRLGAALENRDYTHYVVHGGLAYSGFDCTIPGDWSSAAYPIAAALITDSELTVENVDHMDGQPDQKLVNILIQMGAKIEVEANRVIVRKGSKLKGIKVGINDCVDAITILSVIACFAEGKTEIFDGAIARKKESDRIRAIAMELRKMGAVIEEKEDGLIIFPSALRGAELSSHDDQRMVMSLAVAAFAAEGTSSIDEAQHAGKTYPSFAADFQSLGARIAVKEERKKSGTGTGAHTGTRRKRG
jgi:3-phosphoshikimate 1-carboxyvinyltransferase